jgi:hypothetical protein
MTPLRSPDGVARPDDRTRPQPARAQARHRQRLASSILDRNRRRIANHHLLDVRHDNLEPHPELLQDRPPLGRARSEDERAQASSGKKRPASRAADSFESEPWMRFCPTSTAKSPRIEPGAASSGFVAPITWRAAFTAS